MLNKFENEINDLLVGTFWSILKMEDEILKKIGHMDLSVRETHLISAVGRKGGPGKTVGELAQKLNITTPSVTSIINKLEKKGYVERVRGTQDAREVYIRLTRHGQKMASTHAYFHERMVWDISAEFTDEEKEILTHAMQKLKDFFLRKCKELGTV